MTDTKKSLVISAIVALVFTIGAVSMMNPTTGPQGPAGRDGQDGQQSLGAVPTLDGVDNPNVSIGGVREWHGSQTMIATSSGVCAFRNPFSGTSTIESFSNIVATSSSGTIGAAVFYLSTSSATLGAYGSSTPPLMRRTVAANAQDTVFWKPSGMSTTTAVNAGGATIAGKLVLDTSADGSNNMILAPGEWLTYRYATTTQGSTLDGYWRGSCKAVIRQN